MCFDFGWFQRKSKKKEHFLKYHINYSMWPKYGSQVPTDMSPEASSPIYTPGCLRRPIKYAKKCNNCNCLFYSYEKTKFCSNECEMSFCFSRNRTNSY